MKAINIVLGLIIFCFSVFMLTNVVVLKRTIDRQGFVLVSIMSASWCGPCQAYKPEIERVKYDLANEPIIIQVFEDEEVPGNPGYVPWTLIESQTVPSCRSQKTGYMTALELKARILAVLECQRN